MATGTHNLRQMNVENRRRALAEQLMKGWPTEPGLAPREVDAILDELEVAYQKLDELFRVQERLVERDAARPARSA